MRSEMAKTENYRKKDLDRQNQDRFNEMEEVRAMFRQLATAHAQILATERTTQGSNTQKEKGLLGMPDYQTVTEVNPNNISHVGTSTDGAKLMGPPPDRQPEPYSEYYRAPHEPKVGHVNQDFAYDFSEGEDETPLRPRRTQRHIPRHEERRTPTVNHKVLILLDNGATNNLLTEEAAKWCSVVLQPGKPQTIIMGGGYQLKCLEKGKDMEVIINKRTFKVDSLVIPLEGVDLVLGMTWFLQWKDIHWDVKNFKMTFVPEGEDEPLTLQSLARNVHPKAALRAIDAK
ncbi:hypothetical protein EJ110_NYTH54779 [Nymphaea thermarum]|nr:hypothetical protein EJ110_NYTH54779 [Nymphaea thermarum]